MTENLIEKLTDYSSLHCDTWSNYVIALVNLHYAIRPQEKNKFRDALEIELESVLEYYENETEIITTTKTETITKTSREIEFN